MPSPFGVKVTPPGSVPDTDRVGVGDPVAVTVNDPADPTVNTAVLTLVIAGMSCTVKVKFCVALGTTPFVAVIVKK